MLCDQIEPLEERKLITWASQRERTRLKMPFVIFFSFSSSVKSNQISQIAGSGYWPSRFYPILKRMRIYLIRGRGIDLQGFIQYCMQSLGSFRRIPTSGKFCQVSWYASERSNGVARGEMFICSKLGQNLLEMEVRTFVRIQRVIWDHLLASKAEIIQKQGSF